MGIYQFNLNVLSLIGFTYILRYCELKIGIDYNFLIGEDVHLRKLKR